MKLIVKLSLPIVLMLVVQACNDNSQSQTKTNDSQALDPAATIYTNGDIVTMDTQQPSAQAVAIRDGKIIAVGDRKEVQAQAGNNTQLIDLDGGTLLPGFIDAHGHITYTALNLAAANVSSPPVGTANTVVDVVELLKIHAANTEPESWVIGWGYDDSLLAEKRHLTKADLDQVSTTRPVAIRHVSGHFVSCNTPCLAVAGVNAQTLDPAGGIIRRLEGGKEPDGVLEESAMALLVPVFPKPSKQQRLELIKAAQTYYASFGITTVQDGAAQADEIELLREAAQAQLLQLDIVAYPYAPYLGERLSEFPSSSDYENNFRIGGIKLVLDGSPQGKTAWMTQPYLHPPHGQKEGYTGYATLKDEQVQSFIDRAFESSTQVLAHANGDAAADQLIKVITAANAEQGKADRRTVMIHAQTVREDQIDSMLAQGINPSYFSAHTFYWGDWHRDSVFGVERASRISPLRSSADKGLRYTTHNDTPIVPPDMMRLLWASVNRVTRSGQVLGEAQRATVGEALKSITIDAAYQYFEEDRKGSITVGKMADFVVLDENPLKVAPDAIKDIAVLQTIKDGVAVFLK
ncbi:MAG: putative amidohydrolase YtcJ [Polaribacter sp.]|jgi:predicted amidohydrolase YtcJ